MYVPNTIAILPDEVMQNPNKTCGNLLCKFIEDYSEGMKKKIWGWQ